MHILHRLSTLLVAGIVLLGLHGSSRFIAALVASDAAHIADPLERSLRLSSGRGGNLSLNASERSARQALEKSEETLRSLARQKWELRRERSRIAAALRTIEERYGIDVHDAEQFAAIIQRDQDRIDAIVQRFSKRGTPSHSMLAVLRSLVLGPLVDADERAFVDRILLRARGDMLAFLEDMQTLPATETALRERHAVLQVAYSRKQRERDRAEAQLHASAGGWEENERIVAEVQDQIRRFHGESSRIDAQLRRRAERALVEKGLRAPREGTYSDSPLSGDPSGLRWPLSGRVISAGFKEPSYQRFFGVPHYGIDIVVPQGTSVYSASDGVVFTVQDGGARGYTYVLVGHRGGIATLYGHLSKTYVAEGDEINQGQIIGVSGGIPGTSGSGPMTTGAHLHLEIILDGTHIDPLTVLP